MNSKDLAIPVCLTGAVLPGNSVQLPEQQCGYGRPPHPHAAVLGLACRGDQHSRLLPGCVGSALALLGVTFGAELTARHARRQS